MTDLDQFAAAALTGLLSDDALGDLSDTTLATRAYELASAMIEERAKSHWKNDGEIEKLRSLVRFQDGVIRSGDVATLTTAEREAIEGAINAEHARGAWKWAATLRGLLERLG